jgi:hypothetical protein
VRKIIPTALAVLSLISFVMFYKSEYDGGVYADTHGAVGNIFDSKSVVYFCLFIAFALATIWLRRYQASQD